MTTDELRRIAMAATPGERVWTIGDSGSGDWGRHDYLNIEGTSVQLVAMPSRRQREVPSPDQVLMALSPARILRMLDVIEKAVEMRDFHYSEVSDATKAFDKAIEELAE